MHDMSIPPPTHTVDKPWVLSCQACFLLFAFGCMSSFVWVSVPQADKARPCLACFLGCWSVYICPPFFILLFRLCRLQATSLHVITVHEVMWSFLTFLLALAINFIDMVVSSEDEGGESRLYK